MPAWCRSTRSPTRRTTTISTCRATSTASEPEDLQDIEGHLRGGIPERDLDALRRLLAGAARRARRAVRVRRSPRLSATSRLPYPRSKPPFSIIPSSLPSTRWHASASRAGGPRPLRSSRLSVRTAIPRRSSRTIAESLLDTFKTAPLLDAYDVYQHLMDYWAETMQDDCYLIAADGWVARTARILETDKKGKQKDKGWTCDLIPKSLIVARYFDKEQAALGMKRGGAGSDHGRARRAGGGARRRGRISRRARQDR